MKIKTKEKTHFGYRQGWKVWIDGKKFPERRGYFYTAQNKHECIFYALADRKLGGFWGNQISKAVN